MSTALIFSNLFVWVYFIAPTQIIGMIADGMWFWYHYFSIPLLSRTLLSRWKQLGEVRKKRGFEELLGVIVVNALMRVVGFFVRLTTIIIGLVMIALTAVLGGLVFVLWFMLPLVIIGSFIIGVILLIV